MTRVMQRLADVVIELETRRDDVCARAPPDGEGTTRRHSRAVWRRRVRSLGTNLSCRA